MQNRKGTKLPIYKPQSQTCTTKQISMPISGSCLPKPGKCPRKPFIVLPDRQLQSLLVACTFLTLRVVPSILPEIRYDDLYRNHICTVSLPTVFRYIEGTTHKFDLFQSCVWPAGQLKVYGLCICTLLSTKVSLRTCTLLRLVCVYTAGINHCVYIINCTCMRRVRRCGRFS